MATLSMTRQPFGEVGAARLQALVNTKNRQNAVANVVGSSDKLFKDSTPFSSPSKRPLPSGLADDSDGDAENVDPVLDNASKRSKLFDGTSSKKPLAKPCFSLSVEKSPQAQRTTPVLPALDFALPSGSNSAPAGRSPKQRRSRLFPAKRLSGTSFRRIEPPSFMRRSNTSASLPFSIDAALDGTLASRRSAPNPTKALETSSPKGWFFAIHEDTADEEATNIMEHCAGILDISSDDEAGPSNKASDQGKENVPPMDHPETSSTVAAETRQRRSRRSADVDAMIDVGEERSPLGEMEAEEFYGKGLGRGSVEIVLSDDAVVGPTPKPTDSSPPNELPLQRASESSPAVQDSINVNPVESVSAPPVESLPETSDDTSALEAPTNEKTPIFTIAEDSDAEIPI